MRKIDDPKQRPQRVLKPRRNCALCGVRTVDWGRVLCPACINELRRSSTGSVRYEVSE